MFDISWQELILVFVVALLVIPPKDLPRAMSTAGKWMRWAKGLAREFHAGIDELAREAELAELKQHTADMIAKANRPITLENIAPPAAKPVGEPVMPPVQTPPSQSNE